MKKINTWKCLLVASQIIVMGFCLLGVCSGQQWIGVHERMTTDTDDSLAKFRTEYSTAGPERRSFLISEVVKMVSNENKILTQANTLAIKEVRAAILGAASICLVSTICLIFSEVKKKDQLQKLF